MSESEAPIGEQGADSFHEQSGVVSNEKVGNKILNELTDTIAAICVSNNWISNGKPRIASVTKLLLSCDCERQLQFLLSHQDSYLIQEKRFDSLFRVRSTFATRKIINHLAGRLLEEHFRVGIATEVRSDFGVYDVVIYEGSPTSIRQNGREVVRLEIKASLGLDLEQIERYLWQGSSTLLLIRALTGQVTRFSPERQWGFISFSQQETLSKAKRVLQAPNNALTIPGNYCKWCPDRLCSFNRARESGARSKVGSGGIVRTPDADFQIEMDLLFSNMKWICEKTADIVISELRERGSG